MALTAELKDRLSEYELLYLNTKMDAHRFSTALKIGTKKRYEKYPKNAISVLKDLIGQSEGGVVRYLALQLLEKIFIQEDYLAVKSYLALPSDQSLDSLLGLKHAFSCSVIQKDYGCSMELHHEVRRKLKDCLKNHRSSMMGTPPIVRENLVPEYEELLVSMEDIRKRVTEKFFVFGCGSMDYFYKKYSGLSSAQAGKIVNGDLTSLKYLHLLQAVQTLEPLIFTITSESFVKE